MEKEFVPYELALKMKQLGFNEPCLGFYNKEDRPNLGYCTNSFQDDTTLEIKCTAPLFQQAFRWFDYSTEWSGFILPSTEEGCFDWSIQNYTDHQLSIESDGFYRSREEAELACLEKLIEIVEQKNEN